MPIRYTTIDWTACREAYVTREERPTFTELSNEFALPLDRVTKLSADQGWPALRAKRTAAMIEATGAHQMLLKAVAMQHAVTDKFCSITVRTLEALEKTLDDLDTGENAKLAASTRTGLLNTISFAIGNLARALKEAGVVGMPRALMDQLEGNMPKGPDGKEFLRTALQQINVTVINARKGEPVNSVVVEPLRDPATPPPEREHVTSRTKEGIELRRLLREAEARSKAQFEDVL